MTERVRIWRRRPILFWGVLCFLVPVLGCFGYFGLYVHSGRRAALDAEIARLRARGEPVDFATLLGPPIPADEDGGPLLREAWAWLDEHPVPRDEWPEAALGSYDEFQALSGDEQRAVRDYVRTLEPFLGLVRRGTEKPRWRQEKLSIDPDDELPHVEHIRTSWEGLAAALNAVPESSNPELASQVRLGLLRARGLIAARWDRPLSVIESLVSFVVLANTLWNTRELLERGLIEPSAADVALRPLLRFDTRQMLLHALRADRVMTLQLGRRLVGDDPRVVVDENGKPIDVWPLAGLWRRTVIEHSKHTQAVCDLQDATWSELGGATHGWTHVDAYERAMNAPGSDIANQAEMLTPRIVLKAAHLVALQRLCRVALAASVHRRQHGAWPATLDDVEVPDDIRIDPFTDAPLLYEVLPDGRLRVSSTGPTDAAAWPERDVERNDPEEDGLVWTLR